MKKLTFIILVFLIPFLSYAQDCSRNLLDASQAYRNGRLKQVYSILQGCLNQLNKEEQGEAYKLLTDTYLVLGETEQADKFLYKFLKINPNYNITRSDLVEFRNLYQTYELNIRAAFGLSVGLISPDYVILHHHSYAGSAIQPIDYKETAGFSVGINGDYQLHQNLYLSGSLGFFERRFEESESQHGYRKISAKIKESYLVLPIQARYILRRGKLQPFVGAGYSLHYLVKSSGDLDHRPAEGIELPAFYGFTFSTDSYDLSSQRNKLVHNLVFSGGAQYRFNNYSIELCITYEKGLSNIIDESTRYDDQYLLTELAYIPDDYKVNTWSIGLSVKRNLIRPKKRAGK